MLTNIIDGLSSKLADQWMALLLTPAFVFWAGGFLAWVFHFGWVGPTKLFTALTPTGQIIVLIAAATIVAVSAVVVQRFDLLIIRLLEGYWPGLFNTPRKWLVDHLVIPKYTHKVQRFQLLAQKGVNNLSPEELSECAAVDRYLVHMPSVETFFLPTKLGNTLRAAELHPKDKYGLEAVICWPRLWLLLPDEARQELTDARSLLDTAARLITWSILFLIWTIWAWWVPLVTILVAFYAYGWTLNAAEIYADLLDSSYDLYRTLLYQSLRWPLPTNPAEEYTQGLLLTQYIWRGSRAHTPTFVNH
jgi:hypothetical protein